MANELTAQMVEAAGAVGKSKIEGQIVSQTLDAVDKKTKWGGKKDKGDMSHTYEVSKKVLSAAYEGKGTIADSKG